VLSIINDDVVSEPIFPFLSTGITSIKYCPEVNVDVKVQYL